MALEGIANPQRWAELATPDERPNWDYNTEEGRGHLERYQVAILQGLKRGARKPMNVAKPTEVIQKETELRTEFSERLCETYRLYTPIDPEATGFQIVTNTFVSQVYSEIIHKLQKADGVLAMTSLQIIQIADKVFRNRDTEAKREAEKKRRENSKRTDQRIAVLAAALGRPLSGPSPKLPSPLSQGWSPSKPPTRKPRATLQPKQCALCRGFGHWENECPQGNGEKELASAITGLAELETE